MTVARFTNLTATITCPAARTMNVIRPLLLGMILLVAGAALLPSAADARSVKARNVTLPAGQGSCYTVTPASAGRIECMSRFIPDVGPLDTYFALRPTGRSILDDRGDYPGYMDPSVRLRNGDRWTRPGIRCSMSARGLRCVNKSSHGFVIGRKRTYRF